MLTLENIRRLFDSDYLQGARYDLPQLTNMERVANTPIPVSCSYLFLHKIGRLYSLICRWDTFEAMRIIIYLFSLPFTLVRDLEWRMIPVVTVVAFTLMGIEGIADEIEMPFGTLNLQRSYFLSLTAIQVATSQICHSVSYQQNFAISALFIIDLAQTNTVTRYGTK